MRAQKLYHVPKFQIIWTKTVDFNFCAPLRRARWSESFARAAEGHLPMGLRTSWQKFHILQSVAVKKNIFYYLVEGYDLAEGNSWGSNNERIDRSARPEGPWDRTIGWDDRMGPITPRDRRARRLIDPAPRRAARAENTDNSILCIVFRSTLF